MLGFTLAFTILSSVIGASKFELYHSFFYSSKYNDFPVIFEV